MAALRILIVKTSSMGDVIHALPLVSDIAAALPEAHIEWVVEQGFAAIPALHPAVRQVHAVALRRWRKALWAPATWREVAAARARLRVEPYDRIIDCQGLIKSALIARWARGPISGPDRASAREPLASLWYAQRVALPRAAHAIFRNRLLGASALSIAADGPPRFGLRVPPLARVPLSDFARAGPYAVLLTNASRPTKLWPDAHWQALAAWLAAQGLRSLLFWGSAAEGAATHARAAAMAAASVAPASGLAQIAALLAGARVVVGLDTGLSHLAAAVGAPTVGIFCDYDPALVGLTGQAPCVSLGGVDRAPAAAEVIGAVERVLGSLP